MKAHDLLDGEAVVPAEEPGQVLYIARQETLSDDWEKIKELLGLPPDLALSQDDTVAHAEYTGDRTIGEKGTEA